MADYNQTGSFEEQLAELQRQLAEGGKGGIGSDAKYPASTQGAKPSADRLLAPWYTAEGAKGAGAVVAAPFVAIKNLLTGATEGGEYLKEHGYQPGQNDERAVAAGNALSALVGTGAFGLSRAAADTGSLGTFIGGKDTITVSNGLRSIGEAARLTPDELRTTPPPGARTVIA